MANRPGGIGLARAANRLCLGRCMATSMLDWFGFLVLISGCILAERKMKPAPSEALGMTGEGVVARTAMMNVNFSAGDLDD